MCNGGCCHDASEYERVPRVSFRIRRQYFDAIVQDEKKREVRRVCEYWLKVQARVLEFIVRTGKHPIAVFLCGRDVHRRLILGAEIYATSRDALGREPSEQGKKDLGDGPVIGFDLGGLA